jgi:hypothetical protein
MTFSFSLVDTAGVTRLLDGSLGVEVKLGVRGAAFPVVTPVTDKLPHAPGVSLRRLGTAMGVIELPLTLKAASSALLDGVYDNLRSWVVPGTERGDPDMVYLQVTRDDGAQREIEALGVLGPGDDALGFPLWQRTTLTLFCPDPYWQDQSDTLVTFTNGTGTRSWWPYYPYDLTPTSTFAIQTVVNSGNVEAWPVWTISGPATNPVLVNVTTGEFVAFIGLSLVAGQVLTLDTRERGENSKRVYDNNGSNMWPYVSPTSGLWPLEVGSNQVLVQMSGTTGATAASLSYRRRWAGGHR